jgi:hypothetical protein
LLALVVIPAVSPKLCRDAPLRYVIASLGVPLTAMFLDVALLFSFGFGDFCC